MCHIYVLCVYVHIYIYNIYYIYTYISHETTQLIAREIRNKLQFKYFTGQQAKDSEFKHVDATWR